MNPCLTVDLIRLYLKGASVQQRYLERVRTHLESSRYLATRMGLKFEFQNVFRSARYRFIGLKGRLKGGCYEPAVWILADS